MQKSKRKKVFFKKNIWKNVTTGKYEQMMNIKKTICNKIRTTTF